MSEQKNGYIAAEWESQSCLWVGWPSHDDTDRWPGERLRGARQEIAAMVKEAASGQAVKLLACGEDASAAAQAMLGDVAQVVTAPCGDVWLRDTGPIFTRDGQALRFTHNGWGGQFFYTHDDTVGDAIAVAADKPISRFDFILEGGALEHNGQGALLTTRQCVLNKNRNGWSEAEATAALKTAFDAHVVYWLDEGLAGDHTDGHIDNLARFVSADTVLCQSAYGADDPNAALYAKTAQDLKTMGLRVVQLPSPGRVSDAQGDPVPASYMNFIITNAAVIMPTYGAPSEAEALAALKALFPTRRVVGAPSKTLLTGGGSFHCITQQEPAYV